MDSVLRKRVNSKVDNASAKCSCTHCESMFCFTKRHYCQSCTCKSCRSITCIRQNNEMRRRSSQIYAVYLSGGKSKPTAKKPEDLTEDDINYELDRNKIIVKNQPPKSISEYIDRLVSKSPSERFNIKPESLNEYIELISGKNTQALENYINNLKGAGSQEPIKKSKLRECKGRCEGKCPGKCLRKCRKHVDKRDHKSSKRNDTETEVRSVLLSCPNMEFNTANTKIKAKNDSDDKSSDESGSTTDNSIFKYDIFKKIKDAYNACSCIFCECMPTVMVQSDVCTCKPCECADCNSYMKNKISHKDHKQKHGSLYTPTQYTAKPIKRTEKKQVQCSCKPCDCALCQKSDSNKPCDCDQCRCNECKPSTTMEGAPIGDNEQNSPCDCAPCDCTECTRIRETVSKNVPCRCEVCPNDACAEGALSCNCERPKSLKKSPDGEVQDFDMPTALILNDIYRQSEDMVAMYTSLPRNYGSNLNTKACDCEDCECITCVCKENTINAIKSSQLFSCHLTHSTINVKSSKIRKHSVSNTCDCAPCECQACINSILPKAQTTDGPLKARPVMCRCKCAACLCSNLFPQSIKSGPLNCKCSICRCDRCVVEECTPARLILNGLPIKRGEILTPTAHQAKVQNLMLTKGKLPTTNVISKPAPFSDHLNCNIKGQENIVSYCKKPYSTRPLVVTKPSFGTAMKINKNTADIGTGYTEFNKYDILKYDAYVQSRKWPNGNTIHENNLIDKLSESCISLYSSAESISKISLCDENYFTTSIIRNKNKSLDSSYNSSSFDHLRYQIRLPKSTAETCLEDVMKGNLGTAIKLNSFDTSVNHSKVILPGIQKLQIPVCKTMDPAAACSITINTKSLENNNNRNINCKKGKIYYYRPKKSEFRNKATKHPNIKYDKDANISNSDVKINVYEPIRFDRNETKSVLTMTNNSNRFDFIEDLNQDRIAHSVFTSYDLSNEKISRFVRAVDSASKSKGSSYTFLSYNIDSYNTSINEDYKRVKKTLKEASEFSVKLIKLLETYEKANKEFIKISDKLKASQTNTNRQFIREETFLDIESEKFLNPVSQPRCFGGTTTSWSIITDEGQMLSNGTFTESANDSRTISHTYEIADINNTISKQYLSNSIYKTSLVDSVEKDNKMQPQNTGLDLQTAGDEKDKTHKRYEKPDLNINTANCNTNSYVITSNKEEVVKQDDKIHRKRHKKYCNHSKRNFNFSKRICLKKPAPCHNPATDSAHRMVEVTKYKQKAIIIEDEPCRDSENIETVKSKQKCEVNQAGGTSAPVFGEEEKVPTTSALFRSDRPSTNEIQLQTDFSANTLPSSLKGIYFGREYGSDTTNYTLKSNIEIQEPQKIDQLVGDRLLFVEKEVSCSDLCMEDLEEDIRELLSEYILQPTKQEKLITEKTKVKSTLFCFGSHSSLKVNFLLVRKVSDHTVLVKWSQPQDLTDVQGYELLVDGRAVQKIFNPSKCIAVVTCLPHTDKILLTVRTVTSVAPGSGHYPATTVVYRPRAKK